MCADVRDPLLGDVVEGGGVDHAKAQQEDVCVSVGQSPEFVKLLLRWTERRRRDGWCGAAEAEKAVSLCQGENIAR